MENPIAKLKRNREARETRKFGLLPSLLDFLRPPPNAAPRWSSPGDKSVASIRTAELLELRWEKISSGKIQIVGKSAKTRRSHGISVQPVCSAWLKGRDTRRTVIEFQKWLV